MINPDVVEGQIAGSVAQGIGNTLYEHLAVDEDGNPLATTLMDYLVPSAVEIPPIEYGHIETPSPGPGGYKGVGEGGAIGAPPDGRERDRRRAVALRRDAHRAADQSRTHRHTRPGGPEWLTCTTTPTTSTSTATRTRCSAGCARRRRSTTTSSTTSTPSAGTTTSSAASSTATRSSPARGGILELIKADIEMPPGTLIFEDPPVHTIHRRLLSRVFTPTQDRRARAEDPRVLRARLDPLVGADGFDFVADLGAQMPMRVIGMLLGIPEDDQAAIRDRHRREPPHRGRQADGGRRRGLLQRRACSPTTSTGGPSTRPTTS